MALHGSLATLRQQAPKTEVFAAAFAYLDEVMRPDSEAGKRARSVAAGKAGKIDLSFGAFSLEQGQTYKP